MNDTPIIEEFLQESAIAQDVFDCAVSLVPDIEIDSVPKEVTGTPLYDLLDWKYTRFGHQAQPNLIGAFFLQETGDVWQGKVFGQDAGNWTLDKTRLICVIFTQILSETIFPLSQPEEKLRNSCGASVRE